MYSILKLSQENNQKFNLHVSFLCHLFIYLGKYLGYNLESSDLQTYSHLNIIERT